MSRLLYPIEYAIVLQTMSSVLSLPSTNAWLRANKLSFAPRDLFKLDSNATTVALIVEHVQ